jgi:hypothetical protein
VLHILVSIWWCWCFDFAISHGYVMIPRCISLTELMWVNIFPCLFPSGCILWWGVCPNILSIFQSGCSFIYYWILSSSCILSFVMCFTNIFSQRHVFPFSWQYLLQSRIFKNVIKVQIVNYSFHWSHPGHLDFVLCNRLVLQVCILHLGFFSIWS